MIHRQLIFWTIFTVYLCITSTQASQLPINSDYLARMRYAQGKIENFRKKTNRTIKAQPNTINLILTDIEKSRQIHEQTLPPAFLAPQTKYSPINFISSDTKIISLKELIGKIRPFQQYFIENQQNLNAFILCERHDAPLSLGTVCDEIKKFIHYWEGYSNYAAAIILILNHANILEETIDFERLATCILYRFELETWHKALLEPEPAQWDQLQNTINVCQPDTFLAKQFTNAMPRNTQIIKETLLSNNETQINLDKYLPRFSSNSPFQNNMKELKSWCYINNILKKVKKLEEIYQQLWINIQKAGSKERRKLLLPQVSVNFIGNNDYLVSPGSAYKVLSLMSHTTTTDHYTFGIPVMEKDNNPVMRTTQVKKIAFSYPKLAPLNFGYWKLRHILESLLAPCDPALSSLPFSPLADCLLLRGLNWIIPKSPKSKNLHSAATRSPDNLARLDRHYRNSAEEFEKQISNKIIIASTNLEEANFHKYLEAVKKGKKTLDSWKDAFLWQAILDLLTFTSAHPNYFTIEQQTLSRVENNFLFYPSFERTSAIQTQEEHHTISQTNCWFLLAQGEIPDSIKQRFRHCAPLLFFNLLSQLSKQQALFDSITEEFDLTAAHTVDEEETNMNTAKALGLHMRFNPEVAQQFFGNLSTLIELMSQEHVTWQEIFAKINPRLCESYQALWSALKERHFLDYLQQKINRTQNSSLPESGLLLELAHTMCDSQEFLKTLKTLPETVGKHIISLQEQKGKKLEELFTTLPTKISSYFSKEWEAADTNDAFRAMLTIKAIDKLIDAENPIIYESLVKETRSFENTPCADAKKSPNTNLLENAIWTVEDFAKYAIQKCNLETLPANLIVEILTVILENFSDVARTNFHTSWTQKDLLNKARNAGAPKLVRDFLGTYCVLWRKEKIPQKIDYKSCIQPLRESYANSVPLLLKNIQAKLDLVRKIRDYIEAIIRQSVQTINYTELEIATLNQALELIKYPYQLLAIPPEPIKAASVNVFAFHKFTASIDMLSFMFKQNIFKESEVNKAIKSLIGEYREFKETVLKSPNDCKLILTQPQVQLSGSFQNYWLITPAMAKTIREPIESPYTFKPLTIEEAPIPGEQYAYWSMQCLLQGEVKSNVPYFLEMHDEASKEKTTYHCATCMDDCTQPLTPAMLLTDFLLLPGKSFGSLGFSRHKESEYAWIKWDLMGEHIYIVRNNHLTNELMDQHIDRKTRLYLLHLNPEVLTLEWLNAIKDYNNLLPKQQHTQQPIGQIKFHPWFIKKYWKNLAKMQEILDQQLTLTFGELFQHMWPDLHIYIQYHKKHYPNKKLSEIIRQAHYESLDLDQAIAPKQYLFQALEKVENNYLKYASEGPKTVDEFAKYIIEQSTKKNYDAATTDIISKLARKFTYKGSTPLTSQ
ncbi:MAG: hypothetical protein ABFQ95_05190 [Pseudomonadota bacterium]